MANDAQRCRWIPWWTPIKLSVHENEPGDVSAIASLSSAAWSGALPKVTVLDKALKRQISVDGVDYMVALDPETIRLTQKGKRRPEVELRWRELVSGEAAMAVALNASLAVRTAAVKLASRPAPAPAASAPPTAAPNEASAPAPKKRAVRKPR